jgi:4-amino-4-deoxy-L-arabinose transferase-like glycosyltransferase
MLSTQSHHGTEEIAANARADLLPVLAVALIAALGHILTNGQYGFHRDELQFLSDARHLDWGFVAYPPFTPFIQHISLALFGLSLIGLRLFSVLAQTAVILVSGLMARDLGGRRLAQFTTALAVALAASHL